MKKLILPVLVILSGFMTGCYYNNEQTLYHDTSGVCDTTAVTFSGTIVPILSGNCWGCHSNANAPSFGSNIRLQDYSDVAGLIEHIIATINYEPGHPQMPKNGNKLSNCKLAQFGIWARDGTPNN